MDAYTKAQPQRRSILKIGLLLPAIAMLVACGGGTSEPTASPTTAPAAVAEATTAPTTAPAEPTAQEQPATAAQPAATAASQPAGSVSAFEIDPSQSTASFTLGETLLGQPNTVVGTASNLNGKITVDWDNPANTKIDAIQIDASGFTTDDNMRNNAIRRFILQSDQFPSITFEPTSIEGLPAQVKPGDSLTFKVTGNLKIRDASNPVTFDVTATANSENELTGTATAKVTRNAFQLSIPQVPRVADVTDDVAIELKFVAKASGNASAQTGTQAAEQSAAQASAASVAPVAAKLNLNTATAEQFLTIPNVGERMVREFFEYRPYTSIQQFRREIGKYVDDAQVAAYEQYVFVPISPNDADADTLQQIPGVDANIASQLIAARPYASTDDFLKKVAELVAPEQLAIAQAYVEAQ